MISPTEFIPLAEEIGLIGRVGEWVLRDVCNEAVNGLRRSRLPLTCPRFNSEAAVQVVISALAKSGLAPTWLELEITESVFLAEKEANLGMQLSRPQDQDRSLLCEGSDETLRLRCHRAGDLGPRPEP